MPQLQINQGPQDALLYDNTRSYFHNVSYVRTSNFQVEYRDVEPQNTAQFGSTVQFVIPKAADLMGPVDLRVELQPPAVADLPWGSAGTQAATTRQFMQWVDELGFAMIEKATFSVGSNDIETITGEQMQLKNELMTADEQRLGFHSTLKTGRRAFSRVDTRASAALDGSIEMKRLREAERKVTRGERPGTSATYKTKFSATQPDVFKKPVDYDYTRLIAYCDGTASAQDYPLDTTGAPFVSANRQLNIPLNFFFTKHVSNYFPLAAVAGCNDVRIAIKFRSLRDLVQMNDGGTGKLTSLPSNWTGIVSGKCSLRTHYVHVTGPEANQLMNMEHVRLLKLYQHVHHNFTGGVATVPIDLSFLHPVSTLIITVRRTADMNSLVDASDTDSAQKGYFFYHGNGTPPNYDVPYDATGALRTAAANKTVKVKSIKLTLNGQERHPGLSDGIETDFLQGRLLGMLHSNSNHLQMQQLGLSRDHKSELVADGAMPGAAEAGNVTITLSFAALRSYGGGAQIGDKVLLRDGTGNVDYTVYVRSITNSTVFEFAQTPGGAAINFSAADGTGTPLVASVTANTYSRTLGQPIVIYRDTKDSDAVDKQQALGMLGSKNIYVYPFSLNPEGSNPSGAVNFSKVSHAKLSLTMDTEGVNASAEDFRVDVYALYYNWLQIKDGRALLSFA